jgi:hypothetical protein
MSKLEKKLQQERKAKVMAARERMRNETKKTLNKSNDEFTDEYGAPIIHSYGLAPEDVLKDDH